MNIDIKEILEKYEISTIKNLDKENMNKIIDFLIKEDCEFIEDLISDYLDLFIFDYDEFVRKYNDLNVKYSGNLLESISNDMNILEEFYYD